MAISLCELDGMELGNNFFFGKRLTIHKNACFGNAVDSYGGER